MHSILLRGVQNTSLTSFIFKCVYYKRSVLKLCISQISNTVTHVIVSFRTFTWVVNNLPSPVLWIQTILFRIRIRVSVILNYGSGRILRVHFVAIENNKLSNIV
jgi:hypothetical protein